MIIRALLCAALLPSGLPLAAQVVDTQRPAPATISESLPAPAGPDSVFPPFTHRAFPVLPGSVLPANRIIAFYGNPLSTRMGILGEIPPKQMLAKLEATAKGWEKADTTRGVRRALHLIVTVAQARPGADGMYRARHGDQLIAKVADWAEQNGYLLFLDIQAGQSPIEAEIPRLLPWLRRPYVHLGLDPEFAMARGAVPGKRIGTLDARNVNNAVNVLAKLVDEYHLPPKVLVVHRFTDRMLTNHQAIKTDPRVQVVIHADGFGSPSLKTNIYGLVVTRKPVQFAGLKLFYKNDKPMMTMAQVLALKPTPLYIQYQ